MTETVNYPLPTVHLNGTSKRMLLEGNVKILSAIADLREAINACEFHSRDYYTLDAPEEFANYDETWYNAFTSAKKERVKHINNISEFAEYIEQHIEHISDQ